MTRKMLLTTLGAVLGVLLLTAGPAAAKPPCSIIGWDDCNAVCSLFGKSCIDVWIGSCSGNSRPYTYTCTGGFVAVDDWCSTDCGDPPPPPPGGGCFLPGTQITMADGTTKSIELIQVGDAVLSYDQATGQMKAGTVVSVHDPVVEDHYLVINGSLRVTSIHRFLTAGQWTAIGQLGVGSTMTAMGGVVVPITSVERVDAPAAVYNFAVSRYQTYVANGIIVHNRKEEIEQAPDPEP